MAAGRLVLLMTFILIVILISASVSNLEISMDCLVDDMNLTLVYDCRKNLIEQRDFFTELVDSIGFPRRKLYVSLMTYRLNGLEEVGQFTNSHEFSLGFSQLFEPLANNSNENCPDSLPYDDAIVGTGRALNDSQKNTKKFALFVLYENISSNTSDFEVVEILTNSLSIYSKVRRLFIVITDNEKLELPEKFMIKSSTLNTSLKACLFLMCQWCGRDDRGFKFKNSCYFFSTLDSNQNMTFNESSKRCEGISPGSNLTSFNSDEEMNYVYSLAGQLLRYLSYRVQASDDYVFNFFIGLQGVIEKGAKQYSWSDGNPMVLKQDWEPSPASETCFYISSSKLSANDRYLNKNTWNEINCNETIPVHLIGCEETIIDPSDKIGNISLRLNPERNKFYPFPESYLNLIWLNSNVTYNPLHSLPIKPVKHQLRLKNNLCVLDERHLNEDVNDFVCNRYQQEKQQINFRASYPGMGGTFQMYISNQSGLNNYLTYKFVSGSTVKQRNETLTEKTHMNSANSKEASDFTNETIKANAVFNHNRKRTCQSQNDRLPIPKCLYDTDFEGHRLGCADNSHLQECENFDCPQSYLKCPNSYCIPRHLLQNSVKDCPHGEDEHITMWDVCSGQLTLTLRDLCIAQSLYHSPGDYLEFLCQDQCDPGFVCVSNVAGYSNSNKTIVFSKHIDFQIFNDSNTYFLTPQVYFYFPFYRVVQMSISGCRINGLNKGFSNFDIEEIISLDISDTSIGLGKIQLQNLRMLNASRHKNTSNIFFPPSLEIIDLSNTKVSQSVILKMANLKSLRKLLLREIKSLNVGIEANSTLEVLDLRGSRLEGLKDGYLNWLSIQSALYTDDFRICCDLIRGERIPEEKCHATVDAISTCHDLIGDPVKRVILWVVCIAALVGNLVVVMFKAVWDRAVLSKAYGVFVACLGVSDLIMGVYLLIIAWADIHYRSLYVLEDSNWREGYVCKLAGVLSTFSSQTSTLFICLITLDRYLHVRYSFGEHTISSVGKIMTILLVLFVGVAAAIVPVIVPKWKIYSSNSLCLALPFSAGRHRGWEYSTILFVGVNFVLFLLIAVGQILIFRSFLSKRITTFSSIRRSTRRLQKSIAKQLFLVTLSNFCCWFPVCVIGIASVLGQEFDREIYAWSAVLIVSINSAINPIIYTLPTIYKKIGSSCRD